MYETVFERLTEKAREVMAYAGQEARRLNHEFIGTEHILLGLFKVDDGMAMQLLKEYDLDYGQIVDETKKLVHSGQTMVTMGQLPFTPRASRTLKLALEEAQKLNVTYVGTEHLLLGLLNEGDGVAYQVLTTLGVDGKEIVSGLLDLINEKKAKEEETNVKEKEYWRIPKDSMTLEEALQRCGYEINSKHEIRPEDYSGSVGAFEENGLIKVTYDPNNKEQLIKAIEFRDFLNESKIKYKEEPSSETVAKELDNSIGDVKSIIDKLKGRKKDDVRDKYIRFRFRGR